MEELIAIGIINMFVLLIVFLIFLFKEKIRNAFPIKKKEFFDRILDCFKLRFYSKQIIFSVFIILFIDILIIFISETSWNIESKGIYEFILKSLVAPISEEFLVRGVLLGVVFFFLIPFLFKIKLDFKKFKYTSVLYYLVSLLCVSFFFAFLHKNPELINFIIRFSGGLVYGGLYLFYDKNLLPPIIAHITHNLLVNTGFFS